MNVKKKKSVKSDQQFTDFEQKVCSAGPCSL